MAVFTPINLIDLSDWITQFSLGKVLNIVGIRSGIENSNFSIKTESGEYILTLFEKLSFDQLPFYLKFMHHLAQHDILVPKPIANRFGNIINVLKCKPSTIVTKLEGKSELYPTQAHCAAVGNMLGKMHLAGHDFNMHQSNLRGLHWWCETIPIVLPFLSLEKQNLLRTEIEFQENFFASNISNSLPRGPIHADLFRDNAMFVGTRLTGFFDFYFAGYDSLLFDLAVVVNDWCINTISGELHFPRLHALLQAYSAVRQFTNVECKAWQTLLRAAALRFWLSRLYDFYLPRKVEILIPHDPTHFERILRLRINCPIPVLN